jgi:hypothetical protein
MAVRYVDISIEGLPSFVHALRLSPAQVRLAEKVFLREAARRVKNMAQDNARHLGSVAAKSAEDIRVAGPGVVAYGGKPYNYGAEFGSYQYHQFQRWRGKGDDAGYFLWPAIRKFRETSMAKLWLVETHSAIAAAFNDK